MTGWPKSLSNTVYADREDFKAYWHRLNEVSVHDGCVMWGHRVVVPPTNEGKSARHIARGPSRHLQSKGPNKRVYVWWPKIDADLERVVKSCGRCQEHGRIPSVALLHPWKWPNRPWS